jgi:hypothetical protein
MSETGSNQPASQRPPLVRLARNQEVSLGCGSLIVIALIVLFCSGGGIANFSQEMRAVHSELAELKRLVQQQNNDIQALQNQLSSKP